ncbi:MAG: AI-2E family transporter [Candidatus Liptonbacteria bacterium]|nr:AI-2E family transporter [Candidatus Liptonbacteria bacterium]
MERFQIYFFTALFLAVIFLSFQIFLPFLVPVTIAATLAFLVHPLHEKLSRSIGDRRGISAFISVVATILIIVMPLIFIGKTVFQEAVQFSHQLSSGGAENISRALHLIQESASPYLPGIQLDLNGYLRLATGWFAQNMGTIFTGIAIVTINLLLNLFIGIIAFYYFLKDGKKIVRALVSLSPLPDKNDYEILGKLEGAVSSVVRGSLTIAVIQGILSWIGFSVFGVPNPALLGSIAAIAALVPGVGTSLVLIPAIIYLFAIGSTGHAIGLLIWAVAAVGLIDNILAPFLLERGIKIHPFLILLSVMGGLTFFGPIGFLLGPLVLSLLFAMIEIYRFLMNSESKSFGGRSNPALD